MSEREGGKLMNERRKETESNTRGTKRREKVVRWKLLISSWQGI